MDLAGLGGGTGLTGWAVGGVSGSIIPSSTAGGGVAGPILPPRPNSQRNSSFIFNQTNNSSPR